MASHLSYKHLFHFFRNAYHRDIICVPRFQQFLHFSSTPTENPSPQNSFMADYLVNSCGFSREKALNISSRLYRRHFRPKKPDSVLKFLREKGFNDTHIRNLIIKRPQVLFAKVEKTLGPRFQFLEDLGFFGSDIPDFIVSQPGTLFNSVNNRLLPSIDFLRTILTTDDMVIKAIKASTWLLTCDLKKHMAPNIQFLHKCGASDKTISKFVCKDPRFLLQRTEWLEELTDRVERLGVARNSGMFIYAAHAIGSMSESTLEAKFELLRSFGWSETDIHSAFRKCPNFLTLSEGKFRRAMDFLLNTAGCDHSYIVSHPILLRYSLEKRVIPRYKVMQTLKSKELIDRIPQLEGILHINEEEFLNNYVFRHLENVPDLQEVYMEGTLDLEVLRELLSVYRDWQEEKAQRINQKQGSFIRLFRIAELNLHLPRALSSYSTGLGTFKLTLQFT